MSRSTSMILAIALAIVGAAALPDSAVADDRTVWRATDGMTIKQEAGGKLWRVYRADGSEGFLLEEVARTAQYVLLYEQVTQKHLRLESGRLLIAGRHPRDFTKTKDGDWVRTVQPPRSIVSSIWVMQGGRAGFMRESGNNWREFSTTGEPTTQFVEEERGPVHVQIYNAARGLRLRLESGRCLVNMTGMSDFVPQWNGNWANAAPRHWRVQAPQVTVTSVWVMQGGRTGFRFEGGTTWKEYGAAGRHLNTLVEQERGATHVLLYNASRGVHLRLEAGRCFIRHRGQREYTPHWIGNWTNASPSHWQSSVPQAGVTSVWLIKGGLAGFRQEDGTTWREYSSGGKALSQFAEQERGASHVLLHDNTSGKSVRLEAGRCYLKLRQNRHFAPQWEGAWARQAPSHWRIAKPVTQEIWLLNGGGGYRHEGSPPVWAAYGPDGSAGLRFTEEARTAAYVQIVQRSQNLRIRLLAGELQVQMLGTEQYVRQATGNWAERAPSNWPVLPTPSRLTSTWVYDGGGGFHHAGGNLWTEYNVDGSRKKDFTEHQRTAEFVLLQGKGRAGRNISVKLQEDRCLVLRHGMGGWTLLSKGRWAANAPAHWRTGTGAGGPATPDTVWRGANGETFRYEFGRWMHYAGRTNRLILEYAERTRTSGFIELWNSAHNTGIRLRRSRCEVWSAGRKIWVPGQAGAWVVDSPHPGTQPLVHPKTKVLPLASETVDCTRIKNQTPRVVLRAARAVGQARDGNRYAHLTLDRTMVTATPGALTDDRDNRRGYYLESVKVTMEPTGRHLTLHSDGPGSFTGKGNLSSISGVNLFSGQPVSPVLPQAQIGRGNNFGMRHNESYVDFHVTNGTRAAKVEHTYRLATVVAPGSTWNRNGGTVLYETWESLSGNSLGESDLCGLPPRAVKNFPLLSQATFLAPANFSGKASVKVIIEITFRHVKKEGRFLSLKLKDRSQVEAVTRTYEFDFRALN